MHLSRPKQHTVCFGVKRKDLNCEVETLSEADANIHNQFSTCNRSIA